MFSFMQFSNFLKKRYLNNTKHCFKYENNLNNIAISSGNICCHSSMTSDSNLKPPQRVAGLKILNKSLFEKQLNIPCLIIKDMKLSCILPHVRNFLLKLENFKPVKHLSDKETHIYLNPEKVTKWRDLDDEIRENLGTYNISDSNLEWKSVILTYDNYSAENILKAVLPADIEGLSSFTKVGHIVHVNLREHLIPYKDIIGEVLFDKVPNCKTVVNKTSMIDNTYRNFQMEILRGIDNMNVSVKENKCIFEFDFSKVYWNSRLCTEHERIVTTINSGDVIFDVFAGVGPFSIPLAKKKCYVFANDLNPESYKWLNHNLKKNKIDSNYLKSYNKDGRDFILNEIKQLLPQYLDKKVFILMNLPALSVEFLDCFVGLYDKTTLGELKSPPTVILYCFAKGEDYNNIAKNLLFQNIGWNINDKIIEIFKVRTVSSLKEMMRISFQLDEEILTKIKSNKRKHTQDHDDHYSDGKKQAQES